MCINKNSRLHRSIKCFKCVYFLYDIILTNHITYLNLTSDFFFLFFSLSVCLCLSFTVLIIPSFFFLSLFFFFFILLKKKKHIYTPFWYPKYKYPKGIKETKTNKQNILRVWLDDTWRRPVLFKVKSSQCT